MPKRQLNRNVGTESQDTEPWKPLRTIKVRTKGSRTELCINNWRSGVELRFLQPNFERLWTSYGFQRWTHHLALRRVRKHSSYAQQDATRSGGIDKNREDILWKLRRSLPREGRARKSKQNTWQFMVKCWAVSCFVGFNESCI